MARSMTRSGPRASAGTQTSRSVKKLPAYSSQWFLRTAPYRVVGLAGLAMCLPRMFIVDLNSALHRIVAFIVLGLVLLWVGFSYHRFRHLVSDRETPSDPLPNK